MRITARALVIGTLLLATLGCDLSARRARAVTGTWYLQSVGGHSLPGPVEGRSQMLAGTLEFAPDGSFTEREAWNYFSHGVGTPRPAMAVRGRWTQHGRKVELHLSDGGSGTARLRDDKLTVDLTSRRADRWVYGRRQR